MKLRCLVIDDDPLICDLIQHFCSKVSFVEYCIACENALDGLNLLTSQTFDVLFLDYNMPDIDGKSLLEMKQDDAFVVMITSHENFAVESYNYPQIVDFIVKPISFDRFYRSLKRIEHLTQKTESDKQFSETLFVKDGNKLVQVRLEKLQYIKSESNYVMLYMEGKKIMSLITMKELESKLPPNFIRIHRSYIVNKNRVERIDDNMIVMNTKEKRKSIPISKSYRDDFMKNINIVNK